MATRRREMDLVEREREVAEVEALVDEALEGDGRALVVEGPAGIGKSRLLAEARRRAAEHGALVLAARGTELEREFPFGVVRQLFEAALAGEGARERLLGGSAAPAATVVTAPRDAPDGAEAGEGGSFALLHGLFWLTLNLAAERPVAIAVD